MALLECKSAAEVFENYKRVRARVQKWNAPPPPPKPAPVVIPEPPAQTIPIVVIPVLTEITVHQQESEPMVRKHPSIHRIIAAVCQRYDIDRNDLVSARRTMNVVRPRHIAMYLAKMLTLKSFPEIGRQFGGRDHTTVLFAVNKITRLRAAFVDLDTELSELETILGGKDVVE